MHFASTLKPKRLGDAEPGELIRYLFLQANDPAIAIVLDHNGRSTQLGILRVPGLDFTYAFHQLRDSTNPCLSYGQDWLAEPVVGLETFAGNRRMMFWPGSLTLFNDQVILTLARHPKDYNAGEVFFDLRAARLVEVPGEGAAPIAHWRIWEDGEARTRADAEPLLQMTAQEVP